VKRNAVSTFIAIGILVLAALFPASGTVYADKEFLLQGTVDCGRSSGSRCELGDVVVVWTSDVTGTKQKVTIDVSWVQKQLGTYAQDGLICLDVRLMQDGTLQAIGVSATCGAPDPKRTIKKDDDAKPAGAAPIPIVGSLKTDLALEKEMSLDFSGRVCEGLCIVTELTITNQSAVTATGVTVAEDPDSFDFISGEAIASVGSFDETTNIWTIGTLGPGQTATLRLFSFWNEDPVMENCAQVQTASPADLDSTPGNNASGEDDHACDDVEIQG
jgi:hypothetical protein